jgi:hypothetical protein
VYFIGVVKDSGLHDVSMSCARQVHMSYILPSDMSKKFILFHTIYMLKIIYFMFIINPYPTMTGLKKPELNVKDEDWTFFAKCVLLNNLHP